MYIGLYIYMYIYNIINVCVCKTKLLSMVYLSAVNLLKVINILGNGPCWKRFFKIETTK